MRLMQSMMPQRLHGAPGRLKGRLIGGKPFNLAEGWQLREERPRRASLRAYARAAVRAVLIVLWSLAAIPVQALLVLLPGNDANHPKVTFARVYWAITSRLLGLRVQLVGAPATGGGRPVIFVANHSSWVDIPILGGKLQAVFVSKDDVGRWPLVGTIARLGRTIFVSRNRQATARERDDMRRRLAAGDNLILFPEGTSSDGSRVLPFRSAFFAAAEGPGAPLIQPVSLVVDRLGGLPIGRANRPLFAWYGSMALAPHFWRIVQQSGCRATLMLHPVIDPALCGSRKELAAATWQAVADGAAWLRQNRAAGVLKPTQPGGGVNASVAVHG